MHTLQGELSAMSASDLTIFLGNKAATGTLQLERSGVKKTFSLSGGSVRASSSTDRREFLGQFLLNLGLITEDQFELAAQTQKETKIFLGRILVMTGQVPEEVIARTLATKARESLLEAFRWHDGRFSFDATRTMDAPEGMDLDVQLLDVHREGDYRAEAWTAIEKIIPSRAMKFVVVEQRAAAAADRFDARLLPLIREGQSVADLLLSLHATDFFLHQKLFALVRHGILVPLREESAAPAPVESAPVPATPDDDSRLAALKRRLYTHPSPPRLLVSAKKLYSLEVSAPARYLLSRVNGERSVEAIVRASPLRELEGLSLFESLVADGLIALSE